MKCEDFKSLIDTKDAEACTSSEREAVRRHYRECATCKVWLDSEAGMVGMSDEEVLLSLPTADLEACLEMQQQDIEARLKDPEL